MLYYLHDINAHWFISMVINLFPSNFNLIFINYLDMLCDMSLK